MVAMRSLELVALLEEQALRALDGAVALLEQSHISDERLNWQTGRTHTFNKLDPAARGLVVIAGCRFSCAGTGGIRPMRL